MTTFYAILRFTFFSRTKSRFPLKVLRFKVAGSAERSSRFPLKVLRFKVAGSAERSSRFPLKIEVSAEPRI
jgi:hypothetical protein